MGWYRKLANAALPDPDVRVPWRPTGCDVTCLNRDSPLAVWWLLRVLRFLALSVCFALTMGLVALAPKCGRLSRCAVWAGSRSGLFVMGVSVRSLPLPGHPIPRPSARLPGVLVVSRHMSWLDILVLQAVCGPMRMLAMSELVTWPVLGWLARQVGTVFIDRDRLLALPATVAEVTSALRAGETFGAFPEGATTCGRHALPWRSAVFQAAVDAKAEVLVVRLSYFAADQPTSHAALLRGETAWSSLWRLLKLRGVAAELGEELLPAKPAGVTRRALAVRAAGVAALAGCAASSRHFP